ncbi:hypothetical protein Pmani_027673 [Petrolisthes manimaculis]|uniref:Diacylglycerol kinase n=1 Tax=Petrolisthes manimaculis TaxID=1843537 RepID=A0AAE1TVJ2_9EUCA|nr:hypothetical protein Pmani_027673 [Petrolisthes manimaculis]
MPHQWLEGNLPVSAKCAVCEKTCGSVLRLQDWRCLWCRAMVHTACRPLHPTRCPLGPCRVSIVPPTALTTIGTDESWEATRPQGCSPLLVFVNSKSGDNQGVRFLRRFKQLLNPAQVFDLMNSGPVLGLRLFKCFNPFRILICSGDGSVGWVLSEIDKLHMTNQCQIGVLPLGTGNDLARVLGWGSACDDDTHLPHILEKYERATTKMLDRWCIMSYVSHVSISPQHKDELHSQVAPHSLHSQVAMYEDHVAAHLATLLQSHRHSDVISSAKVLCSTVKSLIVKVGQNWGGGEEGESHASTTEEAASTTDTTTNLEDVLSTKCAVLNDKLDLLLRALHEESMVSVSSVSTATPDESSIIEESPDTSVDLDPADKTIPCKDDKSSSIIHHKKRAKRKQFIEKDALMSRANSLKKAVREIIEHTERAVDDQNEQTAIRQPLPVITFEPSEDVGTTDGRRTGKGLQVLPTIEGSSAEGSPCPSPIPVSGISPFVSSITTNFPLPPVSPIPPGSLPNTSHTRESFLVPRGSLPSNAFYQHPGPIPTIIVPGQDDLVEHISVLSPLPDIRRESHIEFDFPLNIPVPREFADLSRKNSMQEGKDAAQERCPISIEDIEVRIQSSTDNLLDVDEDEPYTFEEKSIKEIRDSLANSLNNSIDFDEDGEYLEERIEEEEKEEEKSSTKEESGDEDKEKTEALDSDETDETVRETKKVEGKQNDEAEMVDDETPEGDTSVIEDICTIQSQAENQEPSVSSTRDLEQDPEHTDKKEDTQPITDTEGYEKANIEEDQKDDKENLQRDQGPEREQKEQGDAKETQNSEIRREVGPGREKPVGEETQEETPSIQTQDDVPEITDDDDGEVPPPSCERIVEGAEALTEDEMEDEEKASRRISSGSTLKTPTGHLTLGSAGPGRDKSRSPERSGRLSISRGLSRGSAAARGSSRKHLPIINPLVSLPMWPNIAAGGSSGGLISKVLLANADALCAAASPLMDLDDSSLEGFSERCTMNNYFGIGIDAKISLDFHNKREEHPEKCRSRTKNFMWYGVLASKEWLCKTYKNLDQRVQLECDGERIPLPSLQGIVVLNIPSFMGGTNFWGGTKEDDCFLAPSFDDRVLEVVAVFGSAQMAASRIINLQHHRIAQCSTIKITILGEAGEEGVPIQVDGEAWTQPPGIVRIVHKNRVQMLCRNRDLEVSLKAWEEKQRSSGSQTKQPTLLADEELPLLATLAATVWDVITCVRSAAVSTPTLETTLSDLAASATCCLEKIWRDNKVIESPNLRMLATELVYSIHSLQTHVGKLLKEEPTVLSPGVAESLQSAVSHLEVSLRCAHEKDSLMHFVPEEEVPVSHEVERKRVHHSKGIFKLKLKRDGRRGGLEREVREWGPEEVAAWLETLHLAEYQESFITHDIRGSELLNLERRDLKELGITKIGHIKRIQQGIREIKENKSHG